LEKFATQRKQPARTKKLTLFLCLILQVFLQYIYIFLYSKMLRTTKYITLATAAVRHGRPCWQQPNPNFNHFLCLFFLYFFFVFFSFVCFFFVFLFAIMCARPPLETPKFRFLTKIFIFDKQNRFSRKFWQQKFHFDDNFARNLDFWQKNLFRTKNSISGKNKDCWIKWTFEKLYFW